MKKYYYYEDILLQKTLFIKVPIEKVEEFLEFAEKNLCVKIIEAPQLKSSLPDAESILVSHANINHNINDEIDHKINENQFTVIHGFFENSNSNCVKNYGLKQHAKGIVVRWFNAESSDNLIEGFKNFAKELDINIIDKNFNFIIQKIKTYLFNCNEEVIFIYNNVKKYDDISIIPKFPKNIKILITTDNDTVMKGYPNTNHIELNEFAIDKYDEQIQIIEETNNNLDQVEMSFDNNAVDKTHLDLTGALDNQYDKVD